jgi:hypothetical protein
MANVKHGIKAPILIFECYAASDCEVRGLYKRGEGDFGSVILERRL